MRNENKKANKVIHGSHIVLQSSIAHRNGNRETQFTLIGIYFNNIFKM